MEDKPSEDKRDFSTSRQIALLLMLIFSSLYVLGPFLFVITRPLFGKVDFENMDWLNPVNAYLSGAVGTLAMFVLCVLLFFRITKQSWRTQLLFGKWSFKYLAIAIVALAGGIFIAEGLHLLNHFILEQFPSAGFLEMEAELNEQHRAWFNPERKELFPIALFVFAFLPAVVEEIIFRGILLKKLEKLSDGKTHFAVIVSSALFAAFHMQPWNILPMIGLAMIFGYLYVHTKDLRYSIIMHFIYNGAQITIAFFYVNPQAV